MPIRAYQTQDHPPCNEIFQSNVPHFFAPSEFDGFQHWLRGQNEGRPAQANSASDHYYVWVEDDRLIACGGFYVFKEKPTATLAWGMVHNDFHRQGLGSKLTAYRLEQIRSIYPEHAIILDTSQHTFSFYERLGFATTQITKDKYAPGLDKYDMILQP